MKNEDISKKTNKKKIILIIITVITVILLVLVSCLEYFSNKENNALKNENEILKKEIQESKNTFERELANLVNASNNTAKELTNSDNLVTTGIEGRKYIGKDPQFEVEKYIDIKIPVLNIEEVEAKKINDKIKDDYKEQIDIVKNSKTVPTDFGNKIELVNFNFQKRDDIIYILTEKQSIYIRSESRENYISYIYDTVAKKELTTKDILNKYSIKDEKIISELISQNPTLEGSYRSSAQDNALNDEKRLIFVSEGGESLILFVNFNGPVGNTWIKIRLDI